LTDHPQGENSTLAAANMRSWNRDLAAADAPERDVNQPRRLCRDWLIDVSPARSDFFTGQR
jgi:hypothetical protein